MSQRQGRSRETKACRYSDVFSPGVGTRAGLVSTVPTRPCGVLAFGRHVEAGPLRFSICQSWAFYRKFDSDVVGVEGLSQGKNSAHLGWSGSISEDEFWNTHQLTRGDRTTRGPDPHTRTMGGLNCYTMCTSKSKTQHEPHQTSGFCRPRHEPRDGARFGAQSESPPSAEGTPW
jgi:hypothetical protein